MGVSVVLFFLHKGILLSVITPSILIYIALVLLDAFYLIGKKIPKKTPKLAKTITAIVVIFVVNLNAQSSLVQVINDLQDKQLTDKTIEQALNSTFGKYTAQTYEGMDGLSERACAMDIRFLYILTTINKIEETNLNIKQRDENLITRRKTLIKNIDNINKRYKKANKEPFIVDLPNIKESRLSLKGNFERINLWRKMVDDNITKPTCSIKCAFNHIDQSSINMVKEIDEIHSLQNQVNKQLTSQEQSFDKLEQIQRNKEIYLTKSGY